MFGTYVGDGKMLCKVQYGGILYTPSDESYLTPLLVCNGVHEQALTSFLTHWLKKGMTCVDVGANIGYFTVLMGYMVGENGTVHAFEPLLDNLKFLKRNVKTNYLDAQTIIHPEAVGSLTSTQTTFYLPDGEQSRGSLRRLEYGQDHDAECSVNVVRLDDVVKGPVDFIKIDVEGNELDVFNGGSRALHDSTIIAFEWNQKVLDFYARQLMQLITDEYLANGYQLGLAGPNGTIRSISAEDVWKHQFINTVLLVKN